MLIFYLDFLWVDGVVPDQKRSVWRAAWTLLPHLDADRRGRQRHGGRCLLECFWPHQHTSRGLCARSSVQERSAVALTSFSKFISTVLSGCFLNFLFVIFFLFFSQRLIQDVQTYVEQLGEGCAANVAVAGWEKSPSSMTIIQNIATRGPYSPLPVTIGTIRCPAHVQWLSSAAWIPVTRSTNDWWRSLSRSCWKRWEINT